MAISRATKAALKALSYPDPDIKKSYRIVRRIEKLTAGRAKSSKTCKIENKYVTRGDYNIPVRIFTHRQTAPKGVILFFHGGGWVNGNIDTYNSVCMDICEILERTVVSVDYRRAPEYKFPTAPEDCYAVAQKLFSGELVSGFLPEDIILMGDSAGGNLAAAVSLMARDRGEFCPKRQILIYPSVYNDHSENSPFESVRENGTDYLLTSNRITGYTELYISDKSDLSNPYFAPLLAEDLHGQPDTLIITAQFCPLRDEGEEYGRRLSDAGNNVSVYRMPDALHGYFTLPVKFRPQKRTYAVIRRFLGDDRISDNSAKSWIKLDNAAKIFPPTTSKKDARVFRFFCETAEPVDKRALQSALDEVMKMFPFYRSILKKGIFWYYFESSDIRPEVREEYKEPCSELFNINRKDLLFEVTYYKNRVNFEVYHALADGGGAAKFFQTLMALYVKRAHYREFDDIETTDYDASAAERKDDSFFKYYNKREASGVSFPKRAYHIRGERLSKHPIGVIEGEISVKTLLEKAHGYNATVTAFVTAVLLKAIGEGMPVRERGRKVIINVPVDLRQYFGSKSARNFFGIIDVEYDFSKQSDRFEDIVKSVSEGMKQNLDRSKIAKRMESLSKMENIFPTRVLPVYIKDPGLKIATYFAERGVTAAVSNLGIIKMPPEMSGYIKKFGVLCSTKRIQACMCSFGDSFVITFTSPFASTDIQCRFFRMLTSMGADVTITSNLGSDRNVVL